MATRLYFSDGTVGPITGFSGAAGWSNAASMNGSVRYLSRYKLDDALTNRVATDTNVAVVNIGLRQHVSDQLAAQTISGTFSCVIRGLESSTSADHALQVIVRVVSGDGATTRATLYSGQAAALNATVGALGEEFSTSAGTRIIPSGTALSSFACADGDRLTVETGMRAYNTVTTSFTTTLRYGNPVASGDFALTSGLTTDLNPWVEFSGNLLFADPSRHARPTVNRAAMTRASLY